MFEVDGHPGLFGSQDDAMRFEPLAKARGPAVWADMPRTRHAVCVHALKRSGDGFVDVVRRQIRAYNRVVVVDGRAADGPANVHVIALFAAASAPEVEQELCRIVHDRRGHQGRRDILKWLAHEGSRLQQARSIAARDG